MIRCGLPRIRNRRGGPPRPRGSRHRGPRRPRGGTDPADAGGAAGSGWLDDPGAVRTRQRGPGPGRPSRRGPGPGRPSRRGPGPGRPSRRGPGPGRPGRRGLAQCEPGATESTPPRAVRARHDGNRPDLRGARPPRDPPGRIPVGVRHPRSGRRGAGVAGSTRAGFREAPFRAPWDRRPGPPAGATCGGVWSTPPWGRRRRATAGPRARTARRG